MKSRWWEFLSLLDQQKLDHVATNAGDDERYTLAYIRRETTLLLRYIKRGKHHVFCDMKIHCSPMDERILKRWRLR